MDRARADDSEDVAGQTAACVDAIKDSALSKAAELRTRYVGVIHPTTWTAAVVGSLLESRKMPCLGNGTGMDGSLLAVFDPKCDEDKRIAPLKNLYNRAPPSQPRAFFRVGGCRRHGLAAGQGHRHCIFRTGSVWGNQWASHAVSDSHNLW